MTTSNKDFYFRLLRISMIQLLKAHGFDKAKPSIINEFTDLYVRFLSLLLQEITKLAHSRLDHDDSIALQDISQAMENLGLIKPLVILDVYDENPELCSDLGMRNFKEWCTIDQTTNNARITATPTPDLLFVKDKTMKPLSMIPEYINQLNFNLKKNDNQISHEENELIEHMINNGDMDDWIRFVIMKQQINTATKLFGKDPKDLDSLPSIPGLKYSVLSDNQLLSNELIPPTPVENNLCDQDQHEDTFKKLLKKLPISNKDNNINNIKLSFEEDILSKVNKIEDNTMNIDETEALERQFESQYREFEDLENHHTNTSLILDHNEEIQLQELEDMYNTFHMSESLDYGNESYNSKLNFNHY